MNLLQALLAMLVKKEPPIHSPAIPQNNQNVPSPGIPQNNQNAPSPGVPPEIANLPVLPQLPPSVLSEELENNRPIVWKYMRKIVTRGVEEDLDEVYLWRLQGTALALYLKASQYEGCIAEMKKFFIETEQYELVSSCDKLSDKIRVNEVIRSSR